MWSATRKTPRSEGMESKPAQLIMRIPFSFALASYSLTIFRTQGVSPAWIKTLTGWHRSHRRKVRFSHSAHWHEPQSQGGLRASWRKCNYQVAAKKQATVKQSVLWCVAPRSGMLLLLLANYFRCRPLVTLTMAKTGFQKTHISLGWLDAVWKIFCLNLDLIVLPFKEAVQTCYVGIVCAWCNTCIYHGCTRFGKGPNCG